MKYFLHDSTLINQDSIVRLISKYGYEGYGIYNAICERIAFMESPIDRDSAIFILKLSKKHQNILDFCIETGLLLQQNNEIFEENLLENAKKYIIRKEKTKEKVKKFREKLKNNDTNNQTDNENVTSYETVTKPLRNQNVTTAKESKVNKSKDKLFIKFSEINISEMDEPQKTYFHIADSFHKLIMNYFQNNEIPTAKLEKENANDWVKEIRLMFETEKYTKENFREVYMFLQKDAFWQKTIQSVKGLRKHFNKLLTNSKQNGKSEKINGFTASEADELAAIFAKHFGNQQAAN